MSFQVRELGSRKLGELKKLAAPNSEAASDFNFMAICVALTQICADHAQMTRSKNEGKKRSAEQLILVGIRGVGAANNVPDLALCEVMFQG